MVRRRGVVNAMVWDDALQAVLSAAQDKTVRQWRLKVRSTVLSVRPFDSTVRAALPQAVLRRAAPFTSTASTSSDFLTVAAH
jgi:hypothetical protein